MISVDIILYIKCYLIIAEWAIMFNQSLMTDQLFCMPKNNLHLFDNNPLAELT